MIDIFNRTYEPSFEELTGYINGDSNKRWKELTGYIEESFNSKPKIFYSRCSAKPGWNAKYKKGSKALCTLYPEKDYFTALIVLNETDMEWFKGIRDDYSKYVLSVYDNAGMMNGTKWLMIDIKDENTLKDVKKLILLKLH